MTLQALSPSFQDIASGSKLILKTHQGPSQETPFKIFKSQSCTSVLPPISRRSPLLPRCLLSRPAYSMIVGDHKETRAFFHFLRGPPDFAVPPQYIFGSSAATFPPPAFHLLGSKKLRGRTELVNDFFPSITSRRRPDPPDRRTATTGLKPMSTSRLVSASARLALGTSAACRTVSKVTEHYQGIQYLLVGLLGAMEGYGAYA
ncbi:hypothetical protein B0H19DRAFT_1235939 [Mycena capillaripes]|nr:hypothetical protein B0H19DRAFT_1235939 [Mycena capillaripes]